MSRPLVAIVGRPNVGKSMLFNKLCGQRLSIVEDTPGVTRDRLYAECEWCGRTFDIVDTGGIEPSTDNEILLFMREQAMLAIDAPDRALLVSPILDMENLILTMMGWAGVTEEQLQRQGEIPTDFGQTLSWNYLCWVREHPVNNWECPVRILYGSMDTMTSRTVVEEYAEKQNVRLTVMDGGEHWFHTPEQLAVLQKWEETEL